MIVDCPKITCASVNFYKGFPLEKLSATVSAFKRLALNLFGTERRYILYRSIPLCLIYLLVYFLS